ncbi:MAG: hypothetical protein CM1200mP10_30130 [Candidatus Neomarinimicrobiota bacterium]|nr:MAG: hypothetical protein CM1200mP10_30130 [Candidatus Neomarinimicrobiota bacterium]
MLKLRENEPRVLFIGQSHAEEILGVEAVLKLITRSLIPPAEVQHMAILKQNLETWIIRHLIQRERMLSMMDLM